MSFFLFFLFFFVFFFLFVCLHGAEADGGAKVAKFTLLMKKGSRQVQQEVQMAVQSGLTDRMLAQQQAEARERQFNKTFVMNYEQRANEQEAFESGAQAVLLPNSNAATSGQPAARPAARLFSSQSRGGRGGTPRGGRGGARRGGGSGGSSGAADSSQNPRYEQEFLKGMGYTKHQGEYRGGQPSFNPE